MTDSADPGAARGTWRTVLPATAMIGVTFGLARYGYGLLLPDISAELELSSGSAGLIASGAYAAYFAANLAVVPLTTRHGPRAAVGAAAVAAVAGMTVIASAGSAAVLALGVLIGGAASGLAFPPYAEVVATQVSPARRDLAWSCISSGTGWGVAVAGPVAIVAGTSWRWAWAAFVVLAVVVGVAATVSAPTRGDGRRHRPQLSWTWFLCPKSRPLLVSAVLVGTASAVWWSFCTEALRDAGLDATVSRAVYAVGGAASLLASLSGLLFARAGLRAGYLLACGTLATSFGLLSVVRGTPTAAVVSGAVFGAAYATVIAAHGIWSARVFADHPAAGLAAVSASLTVGTLLGPALAGAGIARVGYTGVLVVAGCVLLVALPFCPPTARRREGLAGHECRARPARP